MFRNIMGEPKPGDQEELIDACDELGLNPRECQVVIADYTGQNDDPYDGWCAVVNGETEDGDIVEFDTVAFDSLSDLRNDLEAAGFTDITVE